MLLACLLMFIFPKYLYLTRAVRRRRHRLKEILVDDVWQAKSVIHN